MKQKQRGSLYLTDSRVILLKPMTDIKFELEELQLAVGGYIEIVRPLGKRMKVYVNEEGLIGPDAPLARNPHSESVVDLNYYGVPFIVGNMISTYFVPEDESDLGRVTIRAALREVA